MSNINRELPIPVYTLQKQDGGDYVLTIGDNYKYLFKNNNLTNIVWTVTQEYHAHDFWEICLVLRGTSLQRFPNCAPKEMHPGSVYVLRPHDVHCVSPVANRKSHESSNSTVYAHRDIYIPTEKMERLCNTLQTDLYDKLLHSAAPLCTTLSRTETNRLESIINSYPGKSSGFDFTHSVIVQHILCAVLENGMYADSDYPEWIGKLISELNREDFMTKSIPEIIDSVGYNQSYVCRQFKKYTQKTLTDYIHFRKCSYSLSLLANLDIPIAKISHQLNFADQSAYIRIFKSFYNVTPKQYRIKLTKESPYDLWE